MDISNELVTLSKTYADVAVGVKDSWSEHKVEVVPWSNSGSSRCNWVAVHMLVVVLVAALETTVGKEEVAAYD
eukprot:10655160-Ditylum_brightwellii.AAC.1